MVIAIAVFLPLPYSPLPALSLSLSLSFATQQDLSFDIGEEMQILRPMPVSQSLLSLSLVGGIVVTWDIAYSIFAVKQTTIVETTVMYTEVVQCTPEKHALYTTV